MKSKAIIFWCLCLIACVESFYPPSIPNETGYLVVNGFINGSEGPTTIQLTQTISLEEEKNGLPLMGAEVTVEGNDFTVFGLSESDKWNLPNLSYRY